MKLRDRRSILGIDPTRQGLTFVFFERGELIDWGGRACGRELSDGLALLDLLANTTAADVIVLEDPDAEGCLRRARMRGFLRAAAKHVRARGLRAIAVSRRDVREAWKRRGKLAKQAIAESVAELFPELQAFVPPPRKIFMDEDHRLQIFDALTLVLAHSDPTLPVGR